MYPRRPPNPGERDLPRGGGMSGCVCRINVRKLSPKGLGRPYISNTLDTGSFEFMAIQFLHRSPQICGRLKFDKAVSGISFDPVDKYLPL